MHFDLSAVVVSISVNSHVQKIFICHKTKFTIHSIEWDRVYFQTFKMFHASFQNTADISGTPAPKSTKQKMTSNQMKKKNHKMGHVLQKLVSYTQRLSNFQLLRGCNIF
jgi:hypothetical protein